MSIDWDDTRKELEQAMRDQALSGDQQQTCALVMIVERLERIAESLEKLAASVTTDPRGMSAIDVYDHARADD